MNDIELIIKTLKESDKPMNGAALSKATGIDKKVVSDIIKDLKKEGVVHSPVRCAYALI